MGVVTYDWSDYHNHKRVGIKVWLPGFFSGKKLVDIFHIVNKPQSCY